MDLPLLGWGKAQDIMCGKGHWVKPLWPTYKQGWVDFSLANKALGQQLNEEAILLVTIRSIKDHVGHLIRIVLLECKN